VASQVKNLGILLQKTQTGQLNWNLLGIVGGLLVVLVVLWWGVQ